MDYNQVCVGGSVSKYAEVGKALTERDSINAALNEQEKALTELHMAVSALTERLQAVLEDEGPSPVNSSACNTAAVPPVNVLRRIRLDHRSIGDAIGRINRLAGRVQL